MLTFEKVISVFSDYLSKDTRYEILMSSHGYTVMEWDATAQEWADARICVTPEDMKSILLDAYAGYLEYKATLGERPLTDTEQQRIQEQVEKISASCQ